MAIRDIPKGIPPIIPPAGLSDNRQSYLYKHIRKCVDYTKRDIVCPNPDADDDT